MLKFNKIGIISEGIYKDWYISVIDDTHGKTGGYYSLIWNPKEENVGYDDWCETEEHLEALINAYRIEWTDETYRPR